MTEQTGVRVRFLRDELYENEGRNQGHLFRKDEEYTFEPAFAERWNRRGAVEIVSGARPSAIAQFTPLNNVDPAEAEVSDAAKRAAKGEAAKAKAAKSAPKGKTAAKPAPARPAAAAPTPAPAPTPTPVVDPAPAAPAATQLPLTDPK